ncbi:Membrane-associated zinc metalloprotease [Caballeronia sordidicola]|uniref:Membrane-associated zinc metalloprotease n=1 Tax=Caballeronia sordidicola TaxID=196367 RepID=A0A242M6H9_CABSO|nr:Membrane-associated zinc metalloprotease [Caballeronia sordidicola]
MSRARAQGAGSRWHGKRGAQCCQRSRGGGVPHAPYRLHGDWRSSRARAERHAERQCIDAR